MISFPAYAKNFELYPKDGHATQHLAQLINILERVDYTFQVVDPTKNQGQMVSDFDSKLAAALHSCGASTYDLALSADVPQKLDFAFTFGGQTVAVEIEKTDREKILRDLLKCHIYLHAGAWFAMLVLPRNYPHKVGIWNLFKFGVERYEECLKYGFGSLEKMERIVLLGFDQYDAETHSLLDTDVRQHWRNRANAVLQKGKREPSPNAVKLRN